MRYCLVDIYGNILEDLGEEITHLTYEEALAEIKKCTSIEWSAPLQYLAENYYGVPIPREYSI